MDKLTVVSLDSHAMPPPEIWPDYLEREYHHVLPELREDHARHSAVLGGVMIGQTHGDDQADLFDPDGIYRAGGSWGLFDRDIRLAEMDRDGVAAEFVYNGDSRICALGFQASNRPYPAEVCEAGVRAHHRWAYDTFGSAGDRILLVGVTGHAPCRDMDATVAELHWIAEHGFVGTVMPGMTTYEGQLPLFDPHWEPFWAACEELDLTVVVHTGYGPPQGPLSAEFAKVYDEITAAGGTTEHALSRVTSEVLTGEFFLSTASRRPMWQVMFGGVFDRHPDLRLLMTEVRADWLPSTLHHLDAVYDEQRADLPATRRPSEYWRSNCLTCLSFPHKAEIAMRHEIGVETIAFGRDYPHPEGTWPNTREWMQDAYAGVPEDELRKMLGENAIRFLGLDGAKLDAIARRVGPTVREINGGDHVVDPALLAHFDTRGGYLKPSEGDANLATADAMIREDLATLAG